MGDGDILKDAERIEAWFWDGDFDHVLGCVEGKAGEWLVEKGILHTEDDEGREVCDLIEGAVVYRIRKPRALNDEDPREKLFAWWTVNPETGVETMRQF